ncbi:MAG TPA: FAD-linked oxidase, partial [Chryseolinea sp.]
EPYTPIVVEEKYSYGDDTLGLMQSVLDSLEKLPGGINNALIPKLVNALFKLAYDRPEAATGTIGETFNSTKFRGQLFSAAFGIARESVRDVIEHCLEINKSIKLAGVMAFRFVKGTSATLGFTRWENSCVLELDGADTIVNYEFMEALSDRLFAHNIEHTIHWGKVNTILDKDRLKKMYGESRINAWKMQRSRIMNIDMQSMFNNDFMNACGLDEFVHTPLIA